MRYKVNNTVIEYTPEGEKTWGENRVLLEKAIDITEGTSWSKEGYTVEKLFDEILFETFLKNTHDLLIDLWRASGLSIPSAFDLVDYHTVATTQELHLKAIEKTKLLDVSVFPVDVQLLERRISEICAMPLVVHNPFDGQKIFHFRVIRPQLRDNNPLHRDVWLEDFDDCINLYIPIAGSDENASLILAPGTHRWPESALERTVGGAVIDKISFNVPAVTDVNRELNFIRPNPQRNQVLVFSPYIIHGGAANLNAVTTRISVEVRLWKVNP